MKILHTSDWHLGHRLYGYDRTDEFIHFFDQLEKILIAHSPDAMVVSGDIFDVATPPTSVARLFTDNLLRMKKSSPATSIIVTSGNHDSSSRIDIDRNLWREGGINVIGSVARINGSYDFTENIIRIADKGWIVALPFVNRAFLSRKASDNASPEKYFLQEAADRLKELNHDGLPTVLMAHLSVEGSDRTGHTLNGIGGIDSVSLSDFPAEFDYIALGHIHKPQFFRNYKLAYSGSPLPISFDEKYPHGLQIVEVESGKDPVVTKIVLEPLRPLLDFPDEMVDFKNSLKMLRRLPSDLDAYIRLKVCQSAQLPPDCMQSAAEICSDKACRFCVIKYSRPESENAINELNHFESWKFREIPPLEIAEKFLLNSGFDKETSNHSLNLIKRIIEELSIEDSI